MKGLLHSYSNSQNNVPFRPQYNSVSIGKNSQIKPRKSEQGQDVKIMLLEYENNQEFWILPCCSL